MHRTYRIAAWAISGFIAFVILGLLPIIHPTIQTTYTVNDLTMTSFAHGFYRPQTDTMGTVYAWTEHEATATFPYAGTLPAVLHVELRSAAVAGGPDMPIHVLVDGAEVATVHPDRSRLDFQPFQIAVRPGADHAVHVAFMSETFRPGAGDPRVLGTMVRHLALERTDARSWILTWSWLYGALPLTVALAMLTAAPIWRQTLSASRWRKLAGYVVVLIGLAGTLGMLFAVALLAHLGPIDHYRYAFWVEGTLYLAGFLAILTLHLPLGDANAPSILRWITRAPGVAAWLTLFKRLRDVVVIAVPAVIAWPFLGTWGTNDVRDKLDWMQNITTYGLVSGFRVSDNDYPPGTYVILAAVTRIAHRFAIDDLYAYKLSLMVFLVLTGVALYLWTRNSAMAAILQLALLVESVVLGYNDVYFIPTLLLALWALRARRFVVFGLLLGATCMIKWQPLLVAPVLMLAAFRCVQPGKRWIDNAGRIAGIALVPVLFVLGTRIVFDDAFMRALTRGTGDSYLSANALNGYWLITLLLRRWRPAALMLNDNPYKLYVSVHAPLFMIGARLLFVAIYASIVIRWWRTERVRTERGFTIMLAFAYLAYLAYCMVSLSVHENHLVPAVVLAAVLWARDRRYASLFLITAVSLNLNLLLFYDLDGANLAPSIPATFVVSALNLALFVWLLVRAPFRHTAHAPLTRAAVSPAVAEELTASPF